MMKGCRFCEKKGLLIYPVRYAVACPRGAAGVPGLSGQFRIVDAPAEIGTAKYTLRALRGGYLYTYDEARCRLKAYLVTPTGHLWNFPYQYRAPSPDHRPFTCTTRGDLELAHCVDIVHQKGDEATNLWICWSNVQWTNNLICNVSDPDWRKKHMQSINIPEMITGTAVHAGEFSVASKSVAHFALDKDAMTKAFEYSNTPVENELLQRRLAPGIAKMMEQQAPYNRGFIVALNDPVGITSDLSELLGFNRDAGFDEELCRGDMVENILASMEKQVRATAKEELPTNEVLVQRAQYGVLGGLSPDDLIQVWEIIKAGGPANYERKIARKKASTQRSLADRQEVAATEAWNRLTFFGQTATLDETRRKNFRSIYNRATTSFAPIKDRLSLAHLHWLSSLQLSSWMDGVHDQHDIRSGFAYSESLAQCIGKAAVDPRCVDQLKTWLGSEDVANVRHLYCRAMLFNQHDLIMATQGGTELSDIQLENLINIYKSSIERLDRHDALTLFDRLALSTGNILIWALGSTATTAIRGLARARLSMMSGAILRNTNHRTSDLAKWAIREAKAHGVVFETTRGQTHQAALRSAAAVKKRATNPAYIGYELDVAQLQRTGIMEPGAIKGVKIPSIEETKKWLGSGAPREFHLGVATSIIQLIALGIATGELADSDRFNKSETQVRLAIALSSLTGTLLETIGETAANPGAHPLSAFLRNHWFLDLERAAKLARYGRTLAGVAGILAGGYEIVGNALSSFEHGNIPASALYLVNGVLGIVASFASFFTAGPAFIAVFALSIVVGIVIGEINQHAVQVWISRCYFSTAYSAKKSDEYYLSLDEELSAFHKAMVNK